MRGFGSTRDISAKEFFAEALTQLSQSTIPFLVGGAYGMAPYLGVRRDTKDLDVFVRSEHVRHTLGFFRNLGYRVDLTFPHWLGKVYCGDAFMDVIFSSGNGIARVDDRWFAYAPHSVVLGVPVKLCPPEEMIWSKAFVQERERFDGADVLHLIHRFGEALDWKRLLERFGAHWRVLFGHIVTYGFVYPSQRHRIPTWVTDELSARFTDERTEPANQVCNGTLLSREQYLHDVRPGEYQDARLVPVGRMTEEELDIWTAPIRDHE
jgi:hypothetical protein